MMTRKQVEEGRKIAEEMIKKSGIIVTQKEIESMDVADFGLENYPTEGAQIITLLDTKKVGLKIICLMEGQVLPEHKHITTFGEEGKEETFRVVSGTLRLFVPGESNVSYGSKTPWPEGKDEYYTCRKELVLNPTDQVTLPPGTSHWFMGGAGGCVTYTISSWDRSDFDPFTDPNAVRKTVIVD